MIDKSHFSFSKNHPCLAGHLPDNPIVPGAAILDEVLQRIDHCTEIVSAKFIISILPEQICEIIEIKRTDNRLKLEISVAGVTTTKLTVALR